MTIPIVTQPKVIIYGLIDPRDNGLFYVGKTTTKTYKDRIYKHITSGRQGHHTGCARKIRSIQTAGYEPEFFVIEEDCANWVEAEQFWIAYFSFVGCVLRNHTIGGEGLSGMKHSPQSVEKTRLAHLGSKRSEVTKARIKAAWTSERKSAHVVFCKQREMPGHQRVFLSQLHKGKTISLAHRAAISKTFKGKRQTEAQKRKSGAGIKASWTLEKRVAQSVKMTLQRSAQTCCKRGHPFVAGNLYHSKHGVRLCRACSIERYREKRIALGFAPRPRQVMHPVYKPRRLPSA